LRVASERAILLIGLKLGSSLLRFLGQAFANITGEFPRVFPRRHPAAHCSCKLTYVFHHVLEAGTNTFEEQFYTTFTLDLFGLLGVLLLKYAIIRLCRINPKRREGLSGIRVNKLRQVSHYFPPFLRFHISSS